MSRLRSFDATSGHVPDQAVDVPEETHQLRLWPKTKMSHKSDIVGQCAPMSEHGSAVYDEFAFCKQYCGTADLNHFAATSYSDM
jgi:hypothetical protein